MQPKIVILGSGAAGLSAGLSLLENGFENVQIVSSVPGASSVSLWNTLKVDCKEMQKTLLQIGCHKNKVELVNAFSKNLSFGYDFFEANSIKCRKSNLGIIPDYRHPGINVTKVLDLEFAKKGGKIRHCIVNGFLLDGKKIAGLVSGKEKIFGDVFVFAFGGLGNLYKYSTAPGAKYNLVALALEAGFELENLEFNMFHPFLIVDKRLPKAIVSGELLKRAKFVDLKGRQFLPADLKEALAENRHHAAFDRMAREFYLQSRKGKVFAELELSNAEFQNWAKQDEFGWIFEGKKLQEIGRFEIHPAFHYSLGGIKVDSVGRTCFENVFALGECATGLHGASRAGGTAVLECLVFGKIVADRILETGFAGIRRNFKKRLVVPEIKAMEKNLFWECLAPVKNRERLQEIAERKTTQLYLKLLKECAKMSLRTGNVGTNFVE